ncbi:hypothetical protein Efla_002499 [Eimeria flavescens]
MGAFLATPKTEKHSEFGGSKDEMTSEYGVSAMQGWRQTMEDAHVAIPSLKALVECTHAPPAAECAKAFAELQAMDIEDIGIYGVFDGHGSNAVSQWTAANLLTIFSERLLTVRSEMQVKDMALPRGASRAGQSIDSDLLTRENAILCQAIEDTFLAVDEKIQTPESRQALLKIFQDGQREQQGSETYLEWFLKNGGDARVIDMNGQRYIQLLVGNEDGNEGGEESHGDESRVEDADAQETPSSSAEDATNGEVGAPEAKSEHSEGNKVAAENAKPLPLGRLDSTVTAKKTEAEQKAEISPSKKPSDPADAGSPQKQRQQERSAASPEGNTLRSAAKADADTRENATSNDEADEDVESGKGDSVSSDETRASAADKASEEAEMGGASDAQRNEHPHPSSPEGSGATSVVVIVVRGPSPVLIVANAGDSRGVISRGGVAFPLSHDHKPMNPGERARIAAAGGCVTNGRVDGNLNLSRSLGDLYYKSDVFIPPEKQRITAFPDVRVTPICKDDEFVIIACDGIWDCKTNQEAVDFVRAHLAQSKKPSAEALRDACEALCDDCLSHDPIKSEGHGCDNMTVVIVDVSTKLREKGCSSGKIILYGGGEDLYLGQDEAEFEADDDDE